MRSWRLEVIRMSVWPDGLLRWLDWHRSSAREKWHQDYEWPWSLRPNASGGWQSGGSSTSKAALKLAVSQTMKSKVSENPQSKSTAARSAIMRAVGSMATTPEVAVQQIVRTLGYRPRLNCSTLPGSPDL